MKIGALTIWIAWLLSIPFAAGICSDTLYSQGLSEAFRQYETTLPEKVYLHTDKPYYFTGDTIWIKGYQADAVSHSPGNGSRYLYVELINRKNKVIERLKLQQENNTYKGYLPLSLKMEDGDYYLRAYTNWMRNADPDYFFSRNLRIISSQSPFMRPEIRYEQTGNKRKAIVTFRRNDGSLYDGNYVHYMVRTKDKENPFRQQKTNKQGEIYVDIPDRKESEQYLYVVLEDLFLKHNYTFYIPELFDYQVDFFPEGGSLIANTTQKIAFKSIDKQGYPVDIRGYILSRSGDTLTFFESLHHGIGNFVLTSRKGERYTAIVHTKQGEIRRFSLPEPESDRYAISVNNRNDLLSYDILYSEKKFPDKTFYLVGHMRGSLLFVNPLNKPRGSIRIPQIKEGVLSLLLLDKDYIPHSERQVFIRKNKMECMVTPDKSAYGARSPVLLALRLVDENKNPVQGDFSLSVTDNTAVAVDTCGENILSHLLLTSDLKGYIASPGYYFQDYSPGRLVCLDNLMLTHGWSRFDMKELFRKKKEQPGFFMEAGQVISGKVLNATNKPQKDAQVNVFINNRLQSPVFTDENGVFMIENLYYRDTMRVLAQLQEKPQLVRSLLKIDEDSYPPARNRNLYEQIPLRKEHMAYIDTIQSLYVLEEGVWVRQLPEVEIKADAIMKERFSSFKMDDEEMIAQKDARTALHLVEEIPGFYILNNRPYLNPKFSLRLKQSMGDDLRAAERGQTKEDYGSYVRFMLNNRPISFRQLQNINAEDITGIYKIDPEVNEAFVIMNWAKLEEGYRMALTSGASPEELEELENRIFAVESMQEKLRTPFRRMDGGEIHLTSRNGFNPLVMEDSRIDEVYLKGIDMYKQFYVPRYERPEKGNHSIPDKRTTIHWEPSLIPDENGNASVCFYTSDNPVAYTITIEGIANDGSPFRSVFSLNNLK